ncbi:MAG: hypothetical protein LBJ61_10975, partial [Deltaproteobacteria bacterium]|nr:hypothetical protein [Deltaproteobacteria bacterium]
SGPTVSKDLGFRLVVVAPEAVTSTVRQDGFREAFSGLDVVPVEEGRDGPGREKVEKEAKVVDETKLTGIENKGPLDKINVLLETAVDQDQVDVFESLRADIQNINFNEASDDEVTIRTNCRNLLFVVYSIYNTDKRRRDALSDAQLEKDQLAQLDAISAAEKKKYRKQIQELTATIQKNLDVAVKQAESLELALAKEFNSYLDLLSKHDGFDRFEVNNVMILIQQDIKGDDIYAQAMRRAHQQVNLDLGHWRMNNKGAIGLEAILNNAI